MSAYTSAILRYGVVAPTLVNALLLAGALFGSNHLAALRTAKEARYQEYVARSAAVKKMEEEVAPKRPRFEDHRMLLKTDPARLFSQVLDGLLPKYKSFELERTSMLFPLERGRVGRNLETAATRIKTTYEGGLGPMQEALLQIETLMPQAMLEELKITRKADPLQARPDHLDFEMTHICWKSGEGGK